MPRPKTYDDELRTRLLDTAARLLAEQGIHALNLRAVATAAGTSTSAIYSLIGDKGELLRQLYLEGFRRFSARIAAADAELAGGAPYDRLVRFGEVYFESALADPHLYSVMFGPLPQGLVPTDDDVAFALTTLQSLIDAVQDCIDAGEMEGPARDTAMRLWATEHGVASLAIAGMLHCSPAEAVAFARTADAAMARGHAVSPP